MADRRNSFGSSKATWSLVGSLVAHVVVAGGVGWVAYRSLAAKEAREAERRVTAGPGAVIAIELPGVSDGTLLADREVILEGSTPSASIRTTPSRSTMQRMPSSPIS